MKLIKLVFCCYSSCNWLPQKAIHYCNLSALLFFFAKSFDPFWLDSSHTPYLSPWLLSLTGWISTESLPFHDSDAAGDILQWHRAACSEKTVFINCLAHSTFRTLGQNGQAQITVIFAFLKNGSWFILLVCLSLNSVLLSRLLQTFLMFFIPYEQISHHGVAVTPSW